MAKDTVKKDETLEKRVIRLEAYLRKIVKYVEIHWGVDIDKDGEIGSTRIWLMPVIGLFVLVGSIFAADTTIWSLRPSVDETAPDCYVTSDGTDATLVINKITTTTSQTFINPTLSGTITANGTNNLSGVNTITGTTTLKNGTLQGTLTMNGTNNLSGVNTLTGSTTLKDGTLQGTLTMNGTNNISGPLTVSTTSPLFSGTTVTITNNLVVSNSATLGSATINGTTLIKGTTTTITNNLVVSNAFTLGGALTVDNVQLGWTGVVTNNGYGMTNYLWVGRGVITNSTYVGSP